MGEKKKGSVKIKNTSPKLSIILIILITSPWMDQTVRCLRKYYKGVKLQTLFLYLFGVYCMFHQYSNHIQSENRKTKNRKNQRYSGLNMAGTLEQISQIEFSCFYNSTAVRLRTLKAQTNERSLNRTLFSNCWCCHLQQD